MRQLYYQHISERRQPINLKKEDISLFQHEFKVLIRETHLRKLSNVYIFADLIFDIKKIRTFFSYCHIPKSKKIKSIIKRIPSLIRTSQKIENGIWIIDNWSDGYYHWLTDALPRLIAAESFYTDFPVILPSKYSTIEYVTSSLEQLNRKVIFYNPAQYVKIKELLLPSHTALTGNYNKKIINNLRDRFQIKYQNIAKRRIYLSREKASIRKIKNEYEVQSLLRRFDYEIHCFEDYSFKKQVEIMNETKSLVGLHGAGLTNMLFMPENGQVLELRKRDDNTNNCYFSLSSDLNHDYYYQLNEGNKNNTHDAVITVDLIELRKTLELMKTNYCT